MKKFLPLFLVLVFMAGCKETTTTEKVMEIINSEVYSADNIKRIAALIEGSNDIRPEEVAGLRDEVSHFVYCYAEVLTDSINHRLDDPNMGNAELQALLRSIDEMEDEAEKTGVEVFKVEGHVYYDITPIFVADIFKHYLSAAEYSMAEIEQEEFNDPTVIDDAVMVSYDNVTERLWACDKLATSKDCSDDVKLLLQDFRNTYIMTLLYGADNTPAFDWNTHQMRAEVKDALLNYVSEHPNALSTPLLKEYIEILEKSNYYESQATRTFYFNYLRNN